MQWVDDGWLSPERLLRGIMRLWQQREGETKKRAKGSSDQFSAASCLSRYSGARLWREAWKISELGLDHTEIKSKPNAYMLS